MSPADWTGPGQTTAENDGNVAPGAGGGTLEPCKRKYVVLAASQFVFPKTIAPVANFKSLFFKDSKPWTPSYNPFAAELRLQMIITAVEQLLMARCRSSYLAGASYEAVPSRAAAHPGSA